METIIERIDRHIKGKQVLNEANEEESVSSFIYSLVNAYYRLRELSRVHSTIPGTDISISDEMDRTKNILAGISEAYPEQRSDYSLNQLLM